jgi:Nif-specific regulatory protein
MDTRDPVRFLQNEVTRLRQENLELKEELTVLRSSVRSLAAIQDLINRMGPETNLISLLDDLLASALAVLDTSDGSLLLRDEETEELVFAVVHGEARDELTGFRLPPGRGIFYPNVDETFGFSTQTLACVPLVEGNRVLGVIEAINKHTDREFSTEDHQLLLVVAQLSAVAITRAEAFA